MLKSVIKIKPNSIMDKIFIILILVGFTILLPSFYILSLFKNMLECGYEFLTNSYLWSKIALVYSNAYKELKK